MPAYGAVDGEGNQHLQNEGKAHAPGHGNGGLAFGAQFLSDSQPEKEDALNERGDADGSHLVESQPVQRHGHRQQEGIAACQQVGYFRQPHDYCRGHNDAQQQREPGYLAVSLFLRGDVHSPVIMTDAPPFVKR